MQLFWAFQQPDVKGKVSVREVMANSRRDAARKSKTPSTVSSLLPVVINGRSSMRENEFYRDNVERLKERFPDKEWLTTKDVCSFLDCSPKTAHRRFPFAKGGRITIATLARSLSKGQVCK